MDNRFITRGISEETKTFLYGYYIYKKHINKHFIFDIEFKSVDGLQDPPVPFERTIEIVQAPDRFIGLYDMDKNKIWEKDIVAGCGEYEGQSEVFWDDHSNKYQPFSYLNDFDGRNYKVIGSVHFNPELLEDK